MVSGFLELERKMTALILVGSYLIAMIGLGIWGMRRTKTPDDFLLGGRKVGPWVSAFAYGTSYFSAVLFIGFAGKFGWTMGLATLWLAVGYTVFGAWLAWSVLGKRTRRMTRNLEAMTMPEFFGARYQAPAVKMLSAVIIFVFLLPYSASVFKGLGHLFEISFPDFLSYNTALLVMCVITGIYLTIGGYFAVTVTDFVQGLIMILGATAMVVVLVGEAGGAAGVIEAIRTNYTRHIPVSQQPPWWILGALVFMTSFGAWGLPQMVHKFYAIRSERHIATATIVTTVFAAIIGAAAYFTGSLSHVFFAEGLPSGALVVGEGGKTTVAYDILIPEMLSAHLPEFLMGIVLLLVLSASMSTLSSLILVSSASISVDLYKGHVNPGISPKRSLLMMRVVAAVFIALSFFIASNELAVIVTLMSLSWGAVAGAFLAPFVYGLFWRSSTRAGALAGMLTGLGVALLWGGYLVITDQQELIPVAASVAMMVPFLVVPVVSLFTAPPEPALLDRAFSVKMRF
jgi:SSS family solute:Na+ symporter